MNKILSAVFILAVAACHNDNTITTEKYGISLDGEHVKTTVEMEYPQNGDDEILNKIRQQVADLLIADYNGNLADADKILQQFVVEENDKLKAEVFEPIEPIEPYTYNGEIKMTAQTPDFITFEKYAYAYTGGAHGMSFWQAVSVNKRNGEPLNDVILNKHAASQEFKQLLKQGVSAYFSMQRAAVYKCEFQPEKLQDAVFGEFDANNLPLPASKPFLTAKGVGFAYQQYEIASYADGMIAFVIPYNKMRPYLTDEVWNMVEKQQNKDAAVTAYVSEDMAAEYQKYLALPEHKACE